jgi:two-component system sensor histidine kinase RegB
VAEPHQGHGAEIVIRIAPASSAAGAAPRLRRMPEIIHGLRNLVENAVGFAERRVEIIAVWSAVEVEITVSDDGPGFPSAVLARLGEPYVSERGVGQKAGGLGLGFFIAKTLLERSGARFEAQNKIIPLQGAVIRATWPRSAVEATPL